MTQTCEESAITSHPTAGRRPEERKHIFVIDSTAAFLGLMQDIFQDERFNVTTTNYVPRTFDQVVALQPDALIVDVNIGTGFGWNLLERLHEAASTTGIPVLVVSTSPQLLEKAQEQAARYGHHQYLALPFDLNDLLATMDDMLGSA